MKNLKIAVLVLGPVQTNCYLVMNTDTGGILVIDPADKAGRILEEAKKMGGKIEKILLTHGHYDHIGAVEALQRDGTEVLAPEAEAKLLSDPFLNLSANLYADHSVVPDRLLLNGEKISLCGFELEVIPTPGHTAGSACYYMEKAGILFAGDTLFRGSVGRSDLPTGNEKQLIDSIKSSLMDLPGQTVVLPGHGPETTIGYEKNYNPFLQNGGWDMF